jgi:hypothetical protein
MRAGLAGAPGEMFMRVATNKLDVKLREAVESPGATVYKAPIR